MANDPKNLFVYQALYELQPTAVDGTIHRVALIASPDTSYVSIFFDGAPAAGVVPAAEPYRLQFNVCTVTTGANSKFFVKLQLGFEPDTTTTTSGNLGVRSMEAKIWKDGTSEPDDSTHKGRDWMDDIARYSGKYDTTYVRVHPLSFFLSVTNGTFRFGPLPDGKSVPSLRLKIDMEKDFSTTNVSLSLRDEPSKTYTPLVKALKPDQNTFSWDWRNVDNTTIKNSPDAKCQSHFVLFLFFFAFA
jgi:hypothetical protein